MTQSASRPNTLFSCWISWRGSVWWGFFVCVCHDSVTGLCPFPAGGDTFSLQQKHWWQLLSNIKGSFSPEDGEAGCQREGN